MTPGANCGNCRFSLPAKDNAGKIDFTKRWCRWGPPAWFLMPTPKGPTMQCLWPVMGVQDFCFRHEFHAQAELLPGELKPTTEGKTDA